MLVVVSIIGQFCLGQDAGQRMPTIHVERCEHFDVTGRGDAEPWQRAQWHSLSRRPGGELDYTSRFKILYSSKGVYVLIDGTDKRLTATMADDFLDLWNEDVYECFFWTDEQYPVYFEYEISPLGYELPILVPNFGGEFLGWRPWHYEGAKRTQKQVATFGGPQQSKAAVTGWRAEIFFPYELLAPLQNVPPQRGSRWRANFYRMDYDAGQVTQWDWARVGRTFHEFQAFGSLIFD
jgi:hypothetical protein